MTSEYQSHDKYGVNMDSTISYRDNVNIISHFSGASLPGHHQSLEPQTNQLQRNHMPSNVAICYPWFYPNDYISHIYLCV